MTATRTTEVWIELLTLEDLDQLAPLHLQAFAGTLGARLGHAYAKAMLTWFVTYEQGTCLAARDVRGRLVGYVLGAPCGYTAALRKAVRASAMIGLVMNPLLVLRPAFVRKVGQTLGLGPTTGADVARAAGDYQLVAIGVSAASRGQGIGLALLRAFASRAFARGARRLALDVYAHNASAIRAYEAAGWQVAWQDESARIYALDRF